MKNENEIEINGEVYVKKTKGHRSFVNNHPYAIVRCYRSGVLCGYAEHLGGEMVKIHEARQMFRWNSSFVLVDLATNGINIESKNRFSVPSGRPVTVTDACAIIECTDKAAKSLINIVAENHESKND